jgi:hypothetical protein
MTNIRRSIKRTHNYGSYTYAIIESIGINKATVLLKENGARLTNLQVAGSRIKVGDIVIVDYSSGKPVIRPVTPNKYNISDGGLFGFQKPGFSGFPAKPMKPVDPNDLDLLPDGNPTDIGCGLWAFAFEDMDPCTEYTLQFRTADYDTNDFFNPDDSENLLVKIPGLYIAIMRIGFATNTEADTKYVAKILVDGTMQATGSADTIMNTGAIGRTFQISGALVCGINSIVTAKVSQNNNFMYRGNTKKISMVSDDTYHMYPKIQLQWMGVTE